MTPKNNHETRLVINPNILIHDRPDYRGLPHETMAEYLERGGVIHHCKSNCWAEPTFLWVRERYEIQYKGR